MPQQITRVSAYALLRQNDHVLLCRTVATDPVCPNQWTLPGGGLDFGESPTAALVREVHEETGLHIRPTRLADIYNLLLDPIVINGEQIALHTIRIIYFADVLGGTLTYEVDGSTDFCEWIPLADVHDRPLFSLAQVGLSLMLQSTL